MTNYSDFVKRYMKESGKNWNCAVCDIKKGGLYKDFKQGESKQIKGDMEMMGAEDMDAPAKRLFIKRKRLRVAGQKKVKTLVPSPIPPPMALEPADSSTRINMALGSMPELLGAMIQDFARPRAPEGEKAGRLKAIIMYGYALLERRFIYGKQSDKVKFSPEQLKIVKEIIATAERKLGKPMTNKDREEFFLDMIYAEDNKPPDPVAVGAREFLEKFKIEIWEVKEMDWIEERYDDGILDENGDMDSVKLQRAGKIWYEKYVKDWKLTAPGLVVYTTTLLEEMMRS